MQELKADDGGDRGKPQCFDIALEQFNRAARKLKLEPNLAQVSRAAQRRARTMAWINLHLERIMKAAFQEVNETAVREKVDRRTAAYMLAVKRVAEATKVRGLFP